MHGLTEDITSKLTTSIYYIGTNNGYTELENGQKIESVANRLVSFPANTSHRGVTQTDEQRRIVINFNYLKLYAYRLFWNKFIYYFDHIFHICFHFV